MVGRRVGPVALLASPAVSLVDDLLLASLSRASRIADVVLLDKQDGTSDRDVVGLVVHANVLVLDVANGLELVSAARSSIGSARGRSVSRMSLERGV